MSRKALYTEKSIRLLNSEKAKLDDILYVERFNNDWHNIEVSRVKKCSSKM